MEKRRKLLRKMSFPASQILKTRYSFHYRKGAQVGHESENTEHAQLNEQRRVDDRWSSGRGHECRLDDEVWQAEHVHAARVEVPVLG